MDIITNKRGIKQCLYQDIQKLNCALGLERKIVGIKFLYSEEEYESINGRSLRSPMPYCVMVKEASAGIELKAKAEDFKCFGGKKALGMMAVDENSLSGRHYLSLGLHQDIATARKFQEELIFLKYPVRGVAVKPLDTFEENPDVVIIVANPQNIMRILQGYTYKYGLKKDFRLAGSQALCSEITACPYIENSINISLMCSGTRFWCNWQSDEMAAGMAGNLFHDVVEGVIATVNSTETAKEKLKIKERCKRYKETLDVDLYHSYYHVYSEYQVKKTIREEQSEINKKEKKGC